MRKRYIESEKRYYKINADRLKAYSRKWAKENKEKRNKKRREKYALDVKKSGYIPRKRYPNKNKRKEHIIAYYGNICACCSENNIKLLTIDHIDDNGKEHKGKGKNRYKGEQLYRLLIRLNYPKNVQVLCFNCNIGRKNNKGICPHKDI